MSYHKVSLLDDFELPDITHDNIRNQLVKIARQTTAVRQSTDISKMSYSDRLKKIEELVYSELGRYRGFIEVITTEERFREYMRYATKVGYLSVDTETNNSLDPLTCKIMGLCLYIPNTRPVYVPINHCVPCTDVLLDNQVSADVVSEEMHKLKSSNIKIIYHNGKFDLRVINNTLHGYLPIWWDTMLAAQLLDENESAKLKYQYKKYVNPTIGVYNIEKLFKGVQYKDVNPEVFGIYSAIDAFDTYELFKVQWTAFHEDGMSRLFNVFMNVEMPVSPITAKMEDDGICVDDEFLKKLDNKYKQNMENAHNKMMAILDNHKASVEYYQQNGKLDNPVNLSSPQQLKIVIYDVLKIPPIEEGSDATDKATLKLLHNEFTDTLLEFRHYSKLVQSFTLPLQEKLYKGKLHSNYFQMGSEENNVVTGRFCSKDPNLQQIPSKELTVRLMFKASNEDRDVECVNGVYKVMEYEEVECNGVWKNPKDMAIGECIIDEGVSKVISEINKVGKEYYISTR